MRYAKNQTIVRLAFAMQGTAEGLSLEDIRRFDVHARPKSRRTAERLRDAVEALFPQLQLANPGELPKRWRLPAGTVNGLASVTAEELADLETAVALLRRENLLLQADGAARAIAKLKALMKPDAKRRAEPDLEGLTEAEGLAMRPGPRPRIGATMVAMLREAILAARKVRVHYRYRGSGRRGHETVHPYGFLHGSRHYLVAWSENKRAEDFRHFALSNIERVEVLDEGFRKRRFSLRTYAERSFGVFREDPVDVVWKFSPAAAGDAREFLFHPGQSVEDQPDGSLIVRFHAGGLREMAWHLATWGKEVTVLQPRQLREIMRAVAADLLVACDRGEARRPDHSHDTADEPSLVADPASSFRLAEDAGKDRT